MEVAKNGGDKNGGAKNGGAKKVSVTLLMKHLFDNKI